MQQAKNSNYLQRLNRIKAPSLKTFRTHSTRKHKALSLELIRKTVHQHLDDESFGTNQLCALLNTSKSSLYRTVKQETGLSLAVYIRKERMKHAVSLLQNQGLSIQEVATKAGFESSAGFSRWFEKEHGLSPAAYRNQQKRSL